MSWACSRCAIRCQAVEVLSARLCAGCVRAFEAWVAKGVPVSCRSNGYARKGQRRQQIERVVAANGYVTARTLADYAEIDHLAANDLLAKLAKRGELVRLAPGRFAFQRVEAAE